MYYCFNLYQINSNDLLITTKVYSLLISILLIGTICSAQQFTQYTEKDGLASNFVYRALQDKDGFIWFLTDKGISKFDGTTFLNYTMKDGLPTNDIWKLRFTTDDKAWYFTRSDALGYILNDSVYKFPSADAEMMNPNGPINQSLNTITFVNRDMLYTFNDSIWEAEKIIDATYPLVNKAIVYNYKSPKNRWLKDYSGENIHSIKRPELSRYNQINDSLFVYNDDTFYTIVNLNTYQSFSGSLAVYKSNPKPLPTFVFQWMNDGLQLSENNWLINFNDSLSIEKAYPVPQDLKATHTIMDKDGFIWACTSYDGVYKLPKGYNNITSLFEGSKISLIKFIDKTLYIAVDGVGVYTLYAEQPSLFLRENTRLYDIAKVQDQLVFSFKDLLIKKENTKWTRYPRDIENAISKHYLFYKDMLFSSGYNRIFRTELKPKVIYTAKIYENHISYQGVFTQLDTLFSFNYKNFLYYDPSEDAFIRYTDQQILKQYLTHFQIDNSTFIGTEGDGLYVFTNGCLSKLIDEDKSIINSLFVENNQTIWAISEGQLLRYYINDFNHYVIKKYASINGLPTQNLTSVYVEDSRLFLGSTSGLLIINKDAVVQRQDFTPYIKSIFLNNERLRASSIKRQYEHNTNINVNFGVIDFFNTSPFLLQYKLMPIQQEWTTSSSGEVNLSDLKPDTYQLVLKVGQDSVEKIIALPIIIEPLWWQMPSTKVIFIFLCIVLVGLILYYIRKIEIKKKMAQLTMQKKMAEYQLNALRSQMNPHFVFNSLAAIQYYINDNDFITSEKYLVKFSSLIRRFFELSQQETISILEEIELLTNYLDIEKLRFKDKFSYTFKIDPSLDTAILYLPTMLLQPVVENAVNHGIFNKKSNGEIQVLFSRKRKDVLIVEIIDNGVGFARTTKNKKRKKTSTSVVKERLRILNTSQKWSITYRTSEVYPELKDKGNRSVFTIKNNL